MPVALTAIVAVALGAFVSRLIKRHGAEMTLESGPGDSPGSADRGPDGLRM